MPGFKDSKGRSWSLRITPWDMIRVRDFTGVDLGTILQDDMNELVRLLQNARELTVVIYYICKPQCDKLSISDEDFIKATFGDCIEDAAQAFQEGLAECFPSREAFPLIAALEMQKMRGSKNRQKRIDELLIQLTRSDSPSRWQRLCTWIRGNTPVTN